MPSGPGSSQQYPGQEEYYGGEQYGHSQAASEPVSQPYYPDGEARATLRLDTGRLSGAQRLLSGHGCLDAPPDFCQQSPHGPLAECVWGCGGQGWSRAVATHRFKAPPPLPRHAVGVTAGTNRCTGQVPKRDTVFP